MTRRRAAAHGQAGMTLIELLVTVVIMGVAFEVIIGGLGVAIIGSDVNRRQATSDAVLRTSADKLRAAPYGTDCGAAKNDYQSRLDQPDGFTVTVDFVQPADAADATAFVPCVSPAPTDFGVQLVSMTVKSNTRPSTETMQVVKRRA